MKNNLDHILNTIPEIEPPKYLREAVLKGVFKAQQKQLKRKKMIFDFAFSLCGISFLAAGFYFGSQLLASDFWSISMLSFTDASSLVGNWQEYGLSLLETFPAMSIAGILLPVFIMMVMLKMYSQAINQVKFKYN